MSRFKLKTKSNWEINLDNYKKKLTSMVKEHNNLTRKTKNKEQYKNNNAALFGNKEEIRIIASSSIPKLKCFIKMCENKIKEFKNKNTENKSAKKPSSQQPSTINSMSELIRLIIEIKDNIDNLIKSLK